MVIVPSLNLLYYVRVSLTLTLPASYQPTYEELKLEPNELGTTPNSGYQPTYEELKLLPRPPLLNLPPVTSLPMRN
jgi:hypothetical protein